MGGEWGVFQNHHSHEMEEEELDGPSFDKNLPTTCLVSHHTQLSHPHPHPHHPYTDSGPRMLFTTKMYDICEWRQQQGVVWLGTPVVVGVLIGDYKEEGSKRSTCRTLRVVDTRLNGDVMGDFFAITPPLGGRLPQRATPTATRPSNHHHLLPIELSCAFFVLESNRSATTMSVQASGLAASIRGSTGEWPPPRGIGYRSFPGHPATPFTHSHLCCTNLD